MIGGLVLRLIQHTDADEIFSLVDSNRQRLRQWLPWLDFNKTVNDTKTFIRQSLLDYAEQKSMIHVILKDHAIAGIAGFNRLQSSIKAGYIGYWIAESFQGQGLVFQACQELEKVGFDRLGLNKLEIHAASGNARSRAVAERCGYLHTGKILDAEWLYDHFVDHEIYAKRRPTT